MSRIIFLIILSLAAAIAQAQSSTQPTTKPARPSLSGFVIGVWQAPVSDVEKWKGRGVTDFFGHVDHGGAMTQAEWERQVGDKGGYFATYPAATQPAINAQAQQKGRRGFMQNDESDLSNHVDTPGNTPAEHLAKLEMTRPTGLPMFATFAAFDNAWYDGWAKPNKTDGSKYGHRAASTSTPAGGWFRNTDLLGTDFYLAANNRPEAFYVWDRLLDRMRDWGDGQPVYWFIETCPLGRNVPFTPDYFERMVRYVVDGCEARGIKLAGIVYFSHTFQGGPGGKWTGFDGTSPEVVERMKSVNRWLAEKFGPPMTEVEYLRAENAALKVKVTEQGARIQRAQDALSGQP